MEVSSNALLLWMSARRQGSWQQFRTAVERLRASESNDSGGEDEDTFDQFALPFYQTLRLNLQRMGHAEFFAGAGDGADWRVTPPSLAVTQHLGGCCGILVGARSPKLLRRVYEAAGAATLEIQVLPAYPDQILAIADDLRALRVMAEGAGLLLQRDAPAALLTSLPPIDDVCVRHPAQLPFGADWRIDRFSPEDLSWLSATMGEAGSAPGGLFRFSLRHQRYMLYCSGGVAARVPGQVGKYLVLRRRRRQVLRYDVDTRSLSVPASCRPPFLVERALILCSGSPPSYEGGSRSGMLRYAQIPESIAAIAATILRQEVR